MPDENENNIPISELDEALDLTDSAQFPYTQNNGGTLTTFKARLTQIAAKIIEGLSFAGINLPTSAGDKTVENSINFLLDSVGGDPNGNISDSYDPTAAYVKGDLCIYENVLYICTAPTTGTFDPSSWTATTIDNVIGSLSTLTTTDKSSLVGAVNEVVSNKADKSGMFKIQTFTKTYSIEGNGTVYFDRSFITIPTGYVMGAVLEFTSGQGRIAIVSIRPNNTSVWAFELVNTSSVSYNNQTLTVTILFIKSDLVS